MKNIFTKKSSSGFTLIELLVVVAIIGLLSSVVLASLSSARASARDAKKKMELREIYTALQRYWIDNGTSPTNPNAGTTWCAIGTGTCMQELVSPNYFTSLPLSPVSANPYSYYDYGTYFMISVLLEKQAYGPGTRGWHCSDTSGGSSSGSMYYCFEFNKN